MAKLIGDQLFPVLADDSLVGTSGDDYLYGGGASDTLSGGDGVDSIDGGDGIDWITFSDVTGGVDISLLAVAVPVTTVQVVSIDEATAGVIGFDTTSTIVNDPTGGTNKVVRVEKGTGALGAAGTTVFLNDANDSVGVVPFTADSTTVTMRVFMQTPEAGIRVRMKFENANNVLQTVEADALTTDAEGWQTLTFDFANAATNNGNPTARLDLDYTFNKVSVFFGFGLSTTQGGGGTFYFDDINFVASPDPSGVIADDGFGNTESIANVENVLGSAFGDRITGGDGANTLQGVGGNDTIDGGAGNDLLEGGLGNDSIQGGLGNDAINAGDGNDILSGGDGIDAMDGGTGTDTVSFANAADGVEVVVRSGATASTVVNFEESTAPTLASFGPDDQDPNKVDIVQESIVNDPAGGSNKVAKFVKGVGAETWAGLVVSTGPNNSIDPLPLTATDKTMTLRVWTEKPGVQVLLKLESTVNGAVSTGAFATTSVQGGWETLTFTFGPALAGPNTGEFNPANVYNKAVLFFDFGLNGTAGAGTFYFDDLKIISTPVGEIIDDGFGNTETLVNVENVIGSAFADRLTGEGANNSLSGGDGNDTLVGGAGNDTLNGGNGADSMTGGVGNDTYYVGNSTDVVSEAASQGTDTVISSATYTLGANVERLTLSGTVAINGTGNTLANTITGNSASNILSGGGGNDTLSGGAGNDRLDGGTGNDSLVGGTGNDSYVIDSTGDRISETSTLAAEIDSVSSSVTWTLGSNLERLTLTGNGNINGTGNTLANTITGNTGSNALSGGSGNDTLSGGSGNDLLDGGTGSDSLVGGTGNDSYVIDSSGDRISETSTLATEIDSVSSSVTWTLGSNLERLTLTGNGNINGTGNTQSNTITGNTGNNALSGGSGNDTLSGGSGNDLLDGGSGNDRLDGGAGNDSLVGGTGNDSYVVDSTSDVISETSTLATEIDSVSSSVTWTLGSNLEKLTLTGTTAINGTGNTLANTITGNTGNNTLSGSEGNDTLSGGAGNDRLHGGTGNDSLIGGTGNDSYVVDSTSDVISETSTLATEIDSVSSSVTWTLGSNLEKLTLSGTTAINGTGNTLNNTITGNTGNNVLTGGSGNDTLSGGSGNDRLDGGTGNDSLIGSAGNDTLTGGAGLDIFRFSSAISASTNVDTITDFNPADDILQLENSIFTQLTATGVLSALNFRASTTGNAADSNDFVLYETDTGQLFYDADGNGAGVKALIATLDFKPTLTSADIFVT